MKIVCSCSLNLSFYKVSLFYDKEYKKRFICDEKKNNDNKKKKESERLDKFFLLVN